MKIRKSFVTNSSSTSFIIISKKDLDAEKLAKYLGFKKNSPFYSDAVRFCNSILYYFSGGFHGYSLEDIDAEVVKSLFGKRTESRYKKGLKDGSNIVCGRFSDSGEQQYETLMSLEFGRIVKPGFYMDFTDDCY